MSVELKTMANIKYINIKMKKKLKNNSEIIYIIKDAGELCVKILLFLLCCDNLEKIDFEFMKNSVRIQATDDEIIEAVDFWKEKNILDYEIASPAGTKGVNMYNVINILLNVKRDINILNGDEPEESNELNAGLGIYDEKYINGKKEILAEKTDEPVNLDSHETDETELNEKETETEIEAEDIKEIAGSETPVAPQNETPENKSEQIKRAPVNSGPVTIVEISESLETKEEFRRLIHETQVKMQTTFNFSDLGIMYNLHETNNIEVDLIIKLAEICAEEGKNNIRYLEKVALGMAADGIIKLYQYEEKIKEMHKIIEFEDKIKKLFNIESRKLTSKEKNYIKKWAKEFDFSDDILSEGYKRCMKQIENFNFNYINGIYTNWHEKGFRTLNDINNEYGVTPDVMNNIVNRKNAGVSAEQFFEKAVRKGVKF
ncbi:MAG: DnaD domain protein [Oscillospiraceae bacterium]|nr:DnaD domain protein [Oscillospiraceae bacterium]